MQYMQSDLYLEIKNENLVDQLQTGMSVEHDSLQITELSEEENKSPYYSYRGNNDLVGDYQNHHDKVLIELLIGNNIKLIQKIASNYLNYLGHTHTYEDLVTEGILGLIKAVEKFDPSLGFEFSTYATYWIRLVIARSIIDTGTVIRVPVHLVELVLKIKRIERSLGLENRDVNIQTVCGKLKITPEKYKEAKLVEYKYLNFSFQNSSKAEVEEEAVSSDFIGRDRYHGPQYFEEEYSEDPALMVEEADFRAFIRNTLSTLSERERHIIKLRFGFIDGSVKTLKEVGEIYGVTRERVRQIELKALHKLMCKLSKIKKYWAC
ncbi:MAG TPA: sigma-70 family RNA polymerase sigma factor [Desulfosporosinus sp.]